jgi:hypothetical protein
MKATIMVIFGGGGNGFPCSTGWRKVQMMATRQAPRHIAEKAAPNNLHESLGADPHVRPFIRADPWVGPYEGFISQKTWYEAEYKKLTLPLFKLSCNNNQISGKRAGTVQRASAIFPDHLDTEKC